MCAACGTGLVANTAGLTTTCLLRTAHRPYHLTGISQRGVNYLLHYCKTHTHTPQVPHVAGWAALYLQARHVVYIIPQPASAMCNFPLPHLQVPHVAGWAALYLQARPSAPPAEVKAALQAASTPGSVTFGSGVFGGTPNRLLFAGVGGVAPQTAAFSTAGR